MEPYNNFVILTIVFLMLIVLATIPYSILRWKQKRNEDRRLLSAGTIFERSKVRNRLTTLVRNRRSQIKDEPEEEMHRPVKRLRDQAPPYSLL